MLTPDQTRLRSCEFRVRELERENEELRQQLKTARSGVKELGLLILPYLPKHQRTEFSEVLKELD